jgi:hypothetical protein
MLQQTLTPSRSSFLYRGKAAAVALSGNKVTVIFDGQTMTGNYRNGQVVLDKPHPIAVEAAAALRQQRGDKVSALSTEATPESKVKKEVREAIGALDDVFLLSNPVGMATYYSPETNKTREVPFGLGAPYAEGGPDYVVALRRGNGCQMLGLEVKAPGEAPRANQRETHARWIRAGIWIYTVQSGEEAKLAIQDARRRCGTST